METLASSRRHQMLSVSLKPPRSGPSEKIEGAISVVPWFPVSCEGMTSIEPAWYLTRRATYTQTHIHTLFRTLFTCHCWLTIQKLNIPDNHQPLELTHCGEPSCAYGHTHIHADTHAYTTDAPLTVHTHAHTYSYKYSPSCTLSLQLCTGYYEISTVAETWWRSLGVLSLTHTHTHTHSHLELTHTHTFVEGAEARLSPSPSPTQASSLPVIGLSPEAKRPSRSWFNFTAQSLSLKLRLVSRGRQEGGEKKKDSDGYDRHCRGWPGWDDAWRSRGCLLWWR